MTDEPNTRPTPAERGDKMHCAHIACMTPLACKDGCVHPERPVPPADWIKYVPDIVKNAMLTMWNYICDDTKCHPLDIEHGKGKFLTFEPKHWAQFAGDMAAKNIADLTASERPVPQVREALAPPQDLPLYWRCRANAFRQLDAVRSDSDPATIAQCEAYEECAEELKAALTARPSDAAVAWQTVPVVPTLEMQQAGYDALKLFFPDEKGPIGHYRIYEAMLAVAPLYALPPDEPARVTPSTVGDQLNGGRQLPFDRDVLGRMVREAWVRWAQTRPDPKPSWLLPYEQLAESDKEADRQIGEAIARWTLIGDAARHSLASPTIASEKECGKAVGETQPRVVDNDKNEITVSLDGRELRGWSYASDDERRSKMLAAREYVEGWCDARQETSDLIKEFEAIGPFDAETLEDLRRMIPFSLYDVGGIVTRNPLTQVYFRAGLLACREYMARFVEQGGDATTAASIRANWWPQLGDDPGPPRLFDFAEVCEESDGPDGKPQFKSLDISPSIEALPRAYQFLLPAAPPAASLIAKGEGE